MNLYLRSAEVYDVLFILVSIFKGTTGVALSYFICVRLYKERCNHSIHWVSVAVDFKGFHPFVFGIMVYLTNNLLVEGLVNIFFWVYNFVKYLK